jgi:hypothetical protein
MFARTNDDLISEPDVLQRWPALSKSRLRIARHTGLITWVRGKRSSAWYRPSAIETFISKELEQPCRAQETGPYLSSEVNGSPMNEGRKSSTDSGLSPELEELVAQRLVRKIFKKE